MNRTYKIVNKFTKKAICKFSVDSNETINLLSAVKFVGGKLSDDKTEVSFNGGLSYIKICDLRLVDYPQLDAITSEEYIEKQDQASSTNDYQAKINEYERKEEKITSITHLFIAGIILFAIVLFVGVFTETLLAIIIGILGVLLSTIGCGLYRAFSPKLQRVREEHERIIREKNEAERRKEEEKLANIRKTVILSHATLTDKDNAMTRGIVGMALVGTAGAIIGTSTAKKRQTTTFLVVYNDESRETREVENGSELYNIYVQYLEV